MEEIKGEATAGIMLALLTLFREQSALTAGLSAVFHSIHVAARGHAAPRIQMRLIISICGSENSKQRIGVSMNYEQLKTIQKTRSISIIL
jgi:hypothetical protein